MTPIFAQEMSISAVQIGEFVVVLLAFIAGYSRLRKFEDRIAGKGKKIEIANEEVTVREATAYATKAELGDFESKFRRDIHELHGRISSVRTELSGKLDAMDARLDAVPQRTIELLKTIKEYHQK